MAIVGQYISILGDILKIHYLGPVREQLNNSTVLMKRIKRNPGVDIAGKETDIPVHINRNVRIGARADAAVLPQAGKQGYDTAVIKAKYNYGRIEVTGPTIKASRNDKGAFLRVINAEMKGVTNDLKVDINRQMCGDGTGRLCKITSTGTATPLTVTKLFWKHPENMLLDNMPINVLDVTGYTTYHGATGETACMLVNNMTSSTSLPFDQDTAIASTGSGDWVTKNKGGFDGGATGECPEMMGLRGLIDDGNLFTSTAATATGLHPQSIDAGSSSAVSEWRSKVLENSAGAGTARALDLDLMQEAFDYVEIKNGGNVSLILTTPGIRRKYLDLLRADRRFVKEMTLDGGFKAVDYNGTPMVVDRFATNYDIYFLDESTLGIYQMNDFEWMDEDGAVLSRVSNYDAYEAVIEWYANLGINCRNKNCRLADIDETEM